MNAPLLRVLAVCWAVASATMPGLLAVADGVSESRGAPAGIGHAEAPGSAACPLAHDAHCQVCSLLRYHAAVPGRAASLAETTQRGQAVAPAAALAAHAGRLPSGGPRAPPVG